MKRIVALLLVAVILWSICGCGAFLAGEANSILPDQTPSAFLSRDTLSAGDLFYIEIAESLYLIKFQKIGELSEPQKGAFFKWVITNPWYEQQSQNWWNAEKQVYEIPLQDIKRILSTHLDTQTFDPEQAFSPAAPTSFSATPLGYDREQQKLVLQMLGGYGGAAAFEALSIERSDRIVTVELGIYDLNQLQADPPNHLLLERYRVSFYEDTQLLHHFTLLSAELLPMQ